MNNQKLIDAAVLRSIKIKKTIAIASKLPNFLYWLRACNFQLRTIPPGHPAPGGEGRHRQLLQGEQPQPPPQPGPHEPGIQGQAWAYFSLC